MMPVNFPLPMYRGDTFRSVFRFWSDAEKTMPADLTGVVAKAEIRNRPGGTIIVPMACVIDQNLVTVSLTADETGVLPSSAAVWDLQFTYPGGDVVTMLAGAVTVVNDVTDSTRPAPGRAVASVR